MQNADLTEKPQHYKTKKNLLSGIKMGNEILTFGYTEIKKRNFATIKFLSL